MELCIDETVPSAKAPASVRVAIQPTVRKQAHPLRHCQVKLAPSRMKVRIGVEVAARHGGLHDLAPPIDAE